MHLTSEQLATLIGLAAVLVPAVVGLLKARTAQIAAAAAQASVDKHLVDDHAKDGQ